MQRRIEHVILYKEAAGFFRKTRRLLYSFPSKLPVQRPGPDFVNDCPEKCCHFFDVIIISFTALQQRYEEAAFCEQTVNYLDQKKQERSSDK